MDDKRKKIWYAGKVRQEELDEIDSCRLCEIMPELEKTCYATEYCHRQLKMNLGKNENRNENTHERRNHVRNVEAPDNDKIQPKDGGDQGQNETAAEEKNTF